jgi:hypothetical protein
MSALYVGIGELPVGKPSTNGFSAVGSKSLILRQSQPQPSQASEPLLFIPFAYIFGDIVAHGGWVVSDDQTLDGEVSLSSFSNTDNIRIEGRSLTFGWCTSRSSFYNILTASVAR